MPAEKSVGMTRAWRPYAPSRFPTLDHWNTGLLNGKIMKKKIASIELYRGIPERRDGQENDLPFITEEGLVAIDRREMPERRLRKNGLRASTPDRTTTRSNRSI
jgi:hypothetical protein